MPFQCWQTVRSIWTFTLLTWIIVTAVPTVAQSQVPAADFNDSATEAGQVVAEDRATAARIKELMGQIESATELDDETKSQITTVLNQANDELNRAAKLEASLGKDRDVVQAVPQLAQTIKTEIAAAKRTPITLPPEDASLNSLESELAKSLADLQEAKNQLAKAQAEQTRRAERRKQLAGLQASHAERIAEAEQQLAANPPVGESADATTARKLLQLAKLQSLAIEPLANQWEVSRYDAEQAVDLQRLRIEQSAAQVERFEIAVQTLNDRIDVLRKQQARTRVENLKDLAEQIGDPELKSLALQNAALAEENETIIRQTGDVFEETQRSRNNLEQLVDLDTRTRERVDRVGLNGAIGLELRKQLSRLPDQREIMRRGWTRQELMRDVELQRLAREDSLDELNNQTENVNASGLEKRIQNDYTTTLESLTRTYDKYFQQLSDLDFSENQLINATESYRAFLDEHVLWIRSNRFWGPSSLRQSIQRVGQIANPKLWADVGRSIWIDAFTQPLYYLIGGIVMLLLLPARYRGREYLTQLGKTAERTTCTEYSVTLRAAMMTLVMAIVWPLILIFFGWRLTASPLDSQFSVAVGRAVIATGVVLILLSVVRHGNRPKGLAMSHFGWPDRVAELIRRKTWLLRFMMLPFVFLVVLLNESGGLDTDNSLERVCLFASLLILAWALYGILEPRHGATSEYFQRHPNTWVAKTRTMWSWLIIGFPIALAVLVFVGFDYTASELTWRFWHTMWCLISLIVLRAFVIRALQINHRKIRIQKMKERRALQLQTQAAENAKTTTAVAASDRSNKPDKSNKPDTSNKSDKQDKPDKPIEVSVTGDAITIENEHEALRTNSEQVLRILHSGLLITGLVLLWFLWSGLFPAFRILDQWTLWDTTREVVVDTIDDDGNTVRSKELIVDPVTPINILAALLIGLITFTLVRNLPGLIEIVILQRLPLEASFKFAIATMCRYAILVVGLLMIFSAVGANWSKLQWLVAALTVGLGFGLQEIFGNFVSGIIILWERPIRLGDVVTLDNVSGKVTRIQMRATTISDWDRKEYIVPNKDFVTGRLLNWTRSDQVNRIVIPVGVAYGSDVRRAIKILHQVASDHPRIVSDPEPMATFDGFGDSTLNLVLRCFMPDLEGRLQVISELNLAIDDAFAQAKIEIAFPQHDVHLRSVPDGWVQLPHLS